MGIYNLNSLYTYKQSEFVYDDLSLHLDATNPNSYPGSGTAWYDLCQRVHFSSNGTLMPYLTVLGGPCLAFNGSGYWTSDGFDTLVDFGGDCTLVIWLYSYDNTTRKTIFEKAGTIYNSYQQEIAVTWETSEAMTWFSRYNASGVPAAYDNASTSVLPLYVWNMIAIKMSSGKSTTARTGFYSLNGNPWTSNYVSSTSTAVTAAGQIFIGSGYAGTIDTGYLSQVICWNKMLNDSEIKRVYYATRERYGV